MLDMVTSVIVVGDYFSENDASEDDFAILVVLYTIKFPFYLIAIYYTFLAYRELKGIFIEIIESPREGYGVMQNWYERREPPRRSPPPPPQTQPFSGTGYRLD